MIFVILIHHILMDTTYSLIPRHLICRSSKYVFWWSEKIKADQRLSNDWHSLVACVHLALTRFLAQNFYWVWYNNTLSNVTKWFHKTLIVPCHRGLYLKSYKYCLFQLYCSEKIAFQTKIHTLFNFHVPVMWQE